MKSLLNANTLKMLGGGIIIAGAFLIVFPDLMGYFGSIAKLLLMVLVAILTAAFVVRAANRIKPTKSPAASTGRDSTASDGKNAERNLSAFDGKNADRNLSAFDGSIAERDPAVSTDSQPDI